jgi:hypothetical protein
MSIMPVRATSLDECQMFKFGWDWPSCGSVLVKFIQVELTVSINGKVFPVDGFDIFGQCAWSE